MSPPARRKLPPDAPERAQKLAALDLPFGSIAAALGVHRATHHRWCTEPGPEGPERDLCNAIEEGRQQGEAALVERLHKLAADGDARSAQWLLAHSPDWRESWSDAAAERRAVPASQARTLAAIDSVGLNPEQCYRLLLALAAAGEAPLPADPAG